MTEQEQSPRAVRPVPVGNVSQLADMPRRYTEAWTVGLGELLDGDIEQVEFLVWGAIPKKNVILLTGESGAGKSFVAYELARAVAAGGQWLSRGPCVGEHWLAPGVGVPQPVLILNYDNPTDTLKTRLIKLAFDRTMPVRVHTQGMAKLLAPSHPTMLKLLDQADRLKVIIEYFKPSLIIFDSLRQGHNLDENNATEMGQLMAVFKTWTELGAAVVVLHHTSKSDNSEWKAKARGSGELISSSDIVIEVKIENDKKRLEWTKCRTWDIGETKSCGFDIIDSFEDGDSTDDVIQRTTVKSADRLPGEVAYSTIRTVLDKLKANPNGLKLSDIATQTNTARTVINNALAYTRVLDLVSCTRASGGRVYRLNSVDFG